MAMEADKGNRALASEVGVATPQVRSLVLIRVLAEKYRGTEGEAFVCLGYMVSRKRIGESVSYRRWWGRKRMD